ncbi:hypothetical protein L3Q82_002262 [Scortum barcoo]|uniref:Uncharacterized protein n=1 Tax=Scortum barcoo TaxID=214431 RepID=A0ACB8VXU6_9TELE|nr:hypothetical protein L3Q82_002262 [Scortum barcoo]
MPDSVSGRSSSQNGVHLRSAERLRDLCCANRGTFIKVGQHLGALDYLLPEEYTSTLKVLHSRAPQSRMEEIQQVIREDLGKESINSQHQSASRQQIFGGLVNDVQRKTPFLWSDIRDALSLQCLASVLFLYCACMSPVITFGGLLGEATKGNISAIESLFGASLTGVAYSLFAGQPLTILGSTGPVLVFEKILFRFCR